ncbi:MAG: hypothetical protein DLM63_11820 [Solirubrobacterales bacterium]|nr:MAG: hypothetical protein DLM63_11820 [Solirubrobacterales bacterium]
MGKCLVSSACAVSVLLALSALVPTAAAARVGGVSIVVLSNRADLISGGDALVAVGLPSGVAPSRIRVTLRNRDISGEFALRPNGLYEGLVTGLSNGTNVLTAVVLDPVDKPYPEPDGDEPAARLTITNHPIGGPVFSGPQVQPWKCQPGAVDKQCNQPTQYSFVYKSTSPLKPGFQPYNPASPPSDVAMTTTDQGVSVPYIVRIETGYEDRDQYKIATLYRPGEPWAPWAPQKQWNNKLLITHGASCNVDYATGSAPNVTSYNPAGLLGLPVSLPVSPLGDSAEYALAHGFAVMSTALDNNGHNCDVVTQAESLLMAKEHLIESYGTVRYTIGAGCSGGSLAQQWIANAYPGIYQGILPTCSFPDTWSSATQVMDYHLLRTYFENSSHWGPGVAWLPTQWAPIEGNLLPVDAIVSDIGFFNAIVPTHACGGISDQQRYQPQTNPAGVRCSIADLAINVFGPQPSTVWSANETKLGHGFAGVPVDNVGVQYGLSALAGGQITPGQFVDLNMRIGGLDIDINPTAKRIAAGQPALANAYRSGMINETNNLDQTAVIDCRGPDPGAAHDSYRAFAIRARLDREHGTHANQMIWEGPAPIIGDTKCTVESFAAMDRWLAAIEGDSSTQPLVRKIINDKPADVQDQCWDGIGTKISNGLCPPGIVPVYGTPRTVAGDAITTDANKCQLKALSRSDYKVTFTDDQWAQLQTTFPTGVCDYSKPGVSQQPTIPWLTYQDAQGNVIYGGRPLGTPPSSTACEATRSLIVALPRSPRGQRLSSARVYLNGKQVRLLRGRALRSPIALHRFPAGTVHVKIVARTRGRRRVIRNVSFSVCTAA